MTHFPVVDSPARWTHYSVGRSSKIRTVVIHATGGTNSLGWLTWQSDPPVSCHILITKGGTRHRIVLDENTAWHAGRGKLELGTLTGLNPNAHSLSIELENLNDWRDPYPQAQVESCGEQLALWTRRYGRLLLLWHGDLDTRKHDPAGLDYSALIRSYAGVLARM